MLRSKSSATYWVTGFAVLAGLWGGSYAALRATCGEVVYPECDLFTGPDFSPPQGLRIITLPDAGSMAQPTMQLTNTIYWPLRQLDERIVGERVSFVSW